MISGIMGNQSYGELKWCATDRIKWKQRQPKTCSKAAYLSSSSNASPRRLKGGGNCRCVPYFRADINLWNPVGRQIVRCYRRRQNRLSLHPHFIVSSMQNSLA